MEENTRFTVCVECMTYNQANYVTDTLDGFCMQQTTFPFVCTIIDDASTDGEQNVLLSYLANNFDVDIENGDYYKVESYGKLIRCRHNDNRNCFFVVLLLDTNHYQNGNKDKRREYIEQWRSNAKYIAACEGDDYWTDCFKLQKQFDFMESHPSYSLCHHDYQICRNGVIVDREAIIPQKQDLLSIAKFNCVSTLTMFYRNPQEDLVPKNISFDFPIYQFFWNLRLAEMGDIYYINEPMAVYRETSNGIYSKQSAERKFIMAVGNTANMIKWYTLGNRRPDVVKLLKGRARSLAASFIIVALKKGNFISAISMLFKYIKIIHF